MQADNLDPSAPNIPTQGGGVNDPSFDAIPSVNDRGRKRGGQVGPFIAMGGIALVVLIGGLATFNILKAKLAATKPKAETTSTAAAAGLTRTFDADVPPPLPGETAAQTPSASLASQCPDGTSGNILRGQDGVVVRNASGQALRVCANGHVAGVTAPEPGAARPIPVARTDGTSSNISAVGASGPLGGVSDAPMMLNGGTYGNPLGFADAGLQAVTGQVAEARRAPAEGLLTTPRAGSLEGDLIASRTPLVEAARLADVNLLLPKGKTIDCGMSMRIISTLAGQASCVVTQNVYSANGRVVLIERGSEAVGEYRSGISIGQKRLFVLWTRIITPGGVVINLDSPGADELGSTGLTGKVDNHWFERIGSAFLLSTVQDVIQYKIAEEQRQSGGSTVVLGNTARASSEMAQRVLETTINIPPTIYKNQGDRAVIYVARDLDFTNVYALRTRP